MEGLEKDVCFSSSEVLLPVPIHFATLQSDFRVTSDLCPVKLRRRVGVDRNESFQLCSIFVLFHEAGKGKKSF